MDVKETLSNLQLENGAKYGNNIGNAAYLLETITDPQALDEICVGYMEMIKNGEFFSNFLQDVYDVTVKDNKELEKFEQNLQIIMTGWMELYYLEDDVFTMPPHQLHTNSLLMEKYLK